MNQRLILVAIVALVGCKGEKLDAAVSHDTGFGWNTDTAGQTQPDVPAAPNDTGATDVPAPKDSGAQTIDTLPEPDAGTVADSANTDAGVPDTSDKPDTGTPVVPDTADIQPPKEPATVRFIALGDQGEGNDDQYAVGEAAAKICLEKGCDFGLLLGDNFYDVGVSSADDPQFATKFEAPYAKLDIPFYVVLGNHDYGASSFEWYRGEFQKQYALKNPKWKFPKEYYTFVAKEGHADFFAFDTARLMWGDMVEEQKTFLNKAIGDSKALWKIAFAHHPYLSNGQHGNAGWYEGIPLVPILSGGTVKDFMDSVICGKVDLYLCGHDHNRQSFSADASDCGVNFIVNGASSKTSDFKYHNKNKTLWDDDKKEGFIWIELKDKVMTGIWYDKDANLDFQYTVEK